MTQKAKNLRLHAPRRALAAPPWYPALTLTHCSQHTQKTFELELPFEAALGRAGEPFAEAIAQAARQKYKKARGMMCCSRPRTWKRGAMAASSARPALPPTLLTHQLRCADCCCRGAGAVCAGAAARVLGGQIVRPALAMTVQ